MSLFTTLSLDISQQIDPIYRKQYGIFFTPKSIRDEILSISHRVSPKMRILEPSMGSGEFVHDLLPCVEHITGIEISDKIFQKTQPTFQIYNNVHLVQADFLEYDFGNTRFDQIIGNPPYFQITKNKDIYRERYPILGGKFDIYIIFILKCLGLLVPNGVLKFIIPSTFLSTDSYEPIRRFISTYYQIHHIINFAYNKDWIKTNQKTVGLIIEKRTYIYNDPFQLFLPSCYLNSRDSIKSLKDILIHSNGKTISQMGCIVKTGEIIWNNHTDKLTNDTTKALLIHNSYLKKNKLCIPSGNTKRPLFIDCDHSLFITKPVILVNRGNGNNGNFKVSFVYFDPITLPYPTVAENHIYKIYNENNTILLQIFKSLSDNRTIEFIQTCIGSGFITKRFIQQLPIF